MKFVNFVCLSALCMYVELTRKTSSKVWAISAVRILKDIDRLKGCGSVTPQG